MLPDGLSVTTLLPPLDGKLTANSGLNLQDIYVARFGRTYVETRGTGFVGRGLGIKGLTVASGSGYGTESSGTAAGSGAGTAVGVAGTEETSAGTVAASEADG